MIFLCYCLPIFELRHFFTLKICSFAACVMILTWILFSRYVTVGLLPSWLFQEYLPCWHEICCSGKCLVFWIFLLFEIARLIKVYMRFHKSSCLSPQERFLRNIEIQGDHKVFPWLQTFITRKLRGIQTYFFFKCNSTQEVFLQHISTPQHVLLFPRSFLVIIVCNQGKTLC